MPRCWDFCCWWWATAAVAVAERWVSSGATVALISVMPIATALWSGAFGHWPRRLEWVAIAIGAVGAGVMLMGRDLQGSLTGTLMILCGTTCWSLGTVLSRRLDLPHGPLGFGAEMLSAGVIALVRQRAARRALGAAARARGLVGLGLSRRVRLADCVFRLPLRRRAGISDSRRDLRLRQSARRAARRLVAGPRVVLRERSARFAHRADCRRAARVDTNALIAIDASRCVAAAPAASPVPAPANAVR